jgi:UDP-GlcNAc:undecaprenyl-phosphate GlcNAc-1-phosphate transferase
MLIKYVLIILFSFLLGAISLFVLKRSKLIHNKFNLKGISLIGGMGLGLSFTLASLLSFFLYKGSLKEAIGIVISSLIMLAFGMADDLKELSVPVKFLVQVIAASMLVLFGVKTQIAYIGDIPNIIITIIWVLGITNALNHLDVIDGLAGGTALIAGLAFFVISFLNGDIRTAILTLSLTGAIISFLVYNLPPAKIYMGNTGSHFLGFVLAAIALVISYAPLERKVALLTPLLILGFPIFDTIFLMWIRMKKKRSVFKKSNDHLALRFMALDYSKEKALLTMLALCLFFSLCGILVSLAPNLFGITVIMFAVFISFFLAHGMSKVTVNG